MNAEVSSTRTGSHKKKANMDVVPDGFFDSVPRESISRKIFDTDHPVWQKSPPKHVYSQEPQISQENLKAIISQQLKTYLDSIKQEILTDFQTVLNRSHDENKIDNRYILRRFYFKHILCDNIGKYRF